MKNRQDKPILSIISPIYNTAEFLPEFLANVAQQRCAQIEHIIVDGGSTDGSAEIIRTFAEKHPYVRWVSEKDEGPTDAINKGIKMAQGEFMTLLCCNDYYAEDTLNEVTELLPTLKQPAFLVGNCRVTDEGERLDYINKPVALSTTDMILGEPYPFNPVAYFYHKSLHDRIGYYDPIDQMDFIFLLKVFPVAKVHYVDKIYGNYREMVDSITGRAKSAGKLEEIKADLINTFVKESPWHQRWYFRGIQALARKGIKFYYLRRAKFYLCHPSEVVGLMGRKIKRKREYV